MSPKSADSKPLPLSDTLHDLAVLRASDIDLAAFLPSPSGQEMKANTDVASAASGDTSGGDSERDRLVAKSFDYVREGRAVIRLLHRGDVDSQGARVDKVRSGLEEVLNGLAATQTESTS